MNNAPPEETFPCASRLPSAVSAAPGEGLSCWWPSTARRCTGPWTATCRRARWGSGVSSPSRPVGWCPSRSWWSLCRFQCPQPAPGYQPNLSWDTQSSENKRNKHMKKRCKNFLSCRSTVLGTLTAHQTVTLLSKESIMPEVFKS